MASDPSDLSATDEAGSTPVERGISANAKEADPRAFMSSGKRNLSEEELATPAARRFFIFEIERLDREVARLRKIEEQHGDLRVEFAVLRSETRQVRLTELLSFTCLSVGAAGIGAAPSYLTADGLGTVGLVVLISSGLLFAAGVLSRMLK